MPHSLFARSLMIIIVPALLLQAIVMIVFVDNHWKKMTMRYSESVAGEVALIVQGYKVHKQANIIPSSLKSFFRMDITTQKKNIEEKKLIAKGFWSLWAVEFLDEALAVYISDPYEIVYDHDSSTVTIHVDIGKKTISIAFPERRIFTSSSYIFLLWMSFSSFVLSVVAILFMRNQIRPIRKLAVVADRFGRGLDTGTFKPTGAREVRQASRAFLIMRDRIQRQIDQRTTMLAGISHDLRTPLTRLKLGLSILDDDEDDVQGLKNDVDDMDRMINGYLDFVRGDGEEATQQVNLTELLLYIVNQYKEERSRVSYEYLDKDSDSYMVSGRPLALQRSVENLLKNALKYAQNVQLSLEKTEDGVVIHIDDDGDGISEDHYEEVFKPFSRLDDARNASTGGVGLGLTITNDIILSHGGHVTLSRSYLGGLRASVSLYN